MRVKIPKERIGVLIGPDGNVKKEIAELSGVKLRVSSETGDVEIALTPGASDPTVIFRGKDIVTAIGRGFSPQHALRLLDDEVSLVVIDLRDYFGKSKADIQRTKGRIIGRNGKTRRTIEELTGANVSVYGHTVSIIGEAGQFEAARDAIEMLIQGRQHRTVYRFLHRKRMKLRKEALKLWEPSYERPEA